MLAIGISAAWLYSTVALLFPGFFPEERMREQADVDLLVQGLRG